MISKKEIEHIAELARLRLTEKEKEEYAEQLSRVLDYIQELNELNTDDVEPLTHVIPMECRLREDRDINSGQSEDILKRAPEKEANLFKVKKIIE